MSVWCVTFTTFIDDYKLRGRDPSETEGPHLFEREEDARDFLDQRLKEEIEERIGEWSGMSQKEREMYAEYYDQETGEIDDLTGLALAIREGEFVPYKFDWTIKKKTVVKRKKAKN